MIKKKMMLKTNSIRMIFLVSSGSLNPGRSTPSQRSCRSPAYRFPCIIKLIMFGKLLDTASLLKAKLTRDELDQALIAATNEDNWQASTAILHEIASSAYNHEKWKHISDFLWEKLKNNSRWKKILKAMNIVEFLLKNGPGFTVDHLRQDLNFFRTLESFQAYEEGIDRGAPIRERAKAIVALLTNEDLLEDERVRAKQIRERMSHLSGTTNFTSNTNTGPKYESYNSDSFSKSGGTNNNKEFYNYGHGNYGDREDNRQHRDDYFQHVSRKIQSPKKEIKEPIKEIKKVEQTKPKPIQPNIYNSPKKEQKGNYETMAQRLMKAKPIKVEPVAPVKQQYTAPVVPDLSYKKKNVEDLLIDTEANFIENRYHFEPKQIQSQPVTIYPQAIQNPPPVIATNINQSYTSQNSNNYLTSNGINGASYTPSHPAPASNLLSEMDGLLLLGIQPSSNKTEATETANPTVNQITPPIQQNLQIVSQTYPPSLPAQAVQPVQQIQPQFQPQVQQNLTYPQQAPLNQNLSYSPPAPSYTPSYNGYYNQPTSFIQQPQTYNPYAVNSYPNPMMANAPFYAPQPYYPSYPSPIQPQYNNLIQPPPYTYQAPYQPTYSISPVSSTPSTSSISAQNNPRPSSSLTPSATTANNKKNEDQFGDFKNGGSFEMEKINWMSNKEKNLTDLTDFSIDPKDRQKKTERKNLFSNNIRIDPWAW